MSETSLSRWVTLSDCHCSCGLRFVVCMNTQHTVLAFCQLTLAAFIMPPAVSAALDHGSSCLKP